ncbi:hypothetical protein CASFOL_017949 [Castilleja foliolosa]|uniref:DUF4283 domain-containing protein n=1 Tax=Castilleja foliolosa TaxID=1961234 RepID=A0ABD3D8B7_9LAMI
MSFKLIREVNGIYKPYLLLKVIRCVSKPEFDTVEVVFQDKELTFAVITPPLMADHHRPPGYSSALDTTSLQQYPPFKQQSNTSHKEPTSPNRMMPHARSYANTLNPRVYDQGRSNWFWLKPIPPTLLNITTKDKKPAVLFSALEIEESAKQFEHSLVLKFSSGRPCLQEIRDHVNASWNLNMEPVMSLVDAKHVFMILASKEDMVRAQTQVSHRINSSLFRVFRWHWNFNYSKDSSCVPVWIKLPRLPIELINPTMLEKIGTAIGKFLRIDERTMVMTHTMDTRICVEVDLAKDFMDEIWIGETNDKGFWQPIVYEGNVSFCSHCGLLGHVKAVCRKIKPMDNGNNVKHILKRPQETKKADFGQDMLKKVEGETSLVQEHKSDKINNNHKNQDQDVHNTVDKGKAAIEVNEGTTIKTKNTFEALEEADKVVESVSIIEETEKIQEEVDEEHQGQRDGQISAGQEGNLMSRIFLKPTLLSVNQKLKNNRFKFIYTDSSDLHGR